MNPQFPLYIPSKGRSFDNPQLTTAHLDTMGVPYRVIVEEQEFADYKRKLGASKLLVLDRAYQRDYDTFDDLGETKSKGPGAARNFAWDHAVSEGFSHHWVMDDNINGFFRLNRNLKVPLSDGTGFYSMETFCLRYRNIAMAGPNYFMFVWRLAKRVPFMMNRRIYSCNLIRNDVPFRWRGRYNEDTDLSLRMLKSGWCTVQFNAFLQYKITTQLIKGGNTGEFYDDEGTLPKSQMQVAMHPDVSTIVKRFGRWHHHVDYSPFKNNRLVKRSDAVIPSGVDNHGMTLNAYVKGASK